MFNDCLKEVSCGFVNHAKRIAGRARCVCAATVQVVSEAIAEIDYAPASEILFVRFVDGEWYGYFAVPPEVFAAFVAAESHRRFFQREIRDHYRYRRGR